MNQTRIDVMQGEPVEVFARQLNLGGRELLEADDVVDVRVFLRNLTDRTTALEETLLASEVLSALVTSDDGFPLSGGYNFHWILPSGILLGGRKYALEFRLRLYETDGNREREKWIRYEIHVRGARGA